MLGQINTPLDQSRRRASLVAPPRPRPKSESLVPPRSSSAYYPPRGSPRGPPRSPMALTTSPRTKPNTLKTPPELLIKRYTPYPLPGMMLNVRPDPHTKAELPLLTSRDILQYFSQVNELRDYPETRFFPEQYRYIYPAAFLQPVDLPKLQKHVSEPCIHPHWVRWMYQLKDMITEWERAVGMMGKEVEIYLSLRESERQTAQRIDDLNTSSTQGVNGFVEMHLDRGIQIAKGVVASAGNGLELKEWTRWGELMVEFETWKAKYENLHEERRRWTRMKLGYK